MQTEINMVKKLFRQLQLLMLGLIAVLLVLILFTLAQHRESPQLINPGNIFIDDYNADAIRVVAMEEGNGSINFRLNRKKVIWYKAKHIYPELKNVEPKRS